MDSLPTEQAEYLLAKGKLMNASNYDFRTSENPSTIRVANINDQYLTLIGSTIKNCQFDTLIFDSGNWSTLELNNVVCNTLILNSIVVADFKFKALTAKSIKIGEMKFDNFSCEASTIEELIIADISKENSIVNIDNSGIINLDFGGQLKRHYINFIKATIRNLDLHSPTTYLVFKQSSEIRNIKFGRIRCSSILIESSHFNSILSIKDQQHSDGMTLSFAGGSFQNGVEIDHPSVSVNVSDSRINAALKVKSTNATITLSNCPYIESFETSTRLGHHQYVNISNVEFGTLTLLEATSNLSLKNVKIKKQIAFNETTLTEKANFDRVYLDECVIKFHDSSITQAKFHTIRWPKNYEIDEIITKEDTNKLSLLWHKREAYRQFKVVSLSFQNKIDARQFLKNEVRMHYRYVKETLREKFRTTKWKNVLGSKEFGDYLILGSNRLLSNFGESLIRPLSGLLLSTLIFLLLALWEKNIDLGIKFEFNICNWELDATLKGIGVYLNMLSPVHSIEIANVYDSTIKYSITGISDFFMRILAGYFLFYFVRATRKFNFDI